MSDSKQPVIFISHRTTDEAVANMLLEFLIGTGIPREYIFCSSLPGNDVIECISQEIKLKLYDSIINIVILSKDYYKSAYCLNEAGIIWYNDTATIIVAMPEIVPDNMYGFLNNEYKIRRLDCYTDISAIYDTICGKVGITSQSASIIVSEIQKLQNKYSNLLLSRENTNLNQIDISFDSITTDDERIVLYYILSKNVRKSEVKEVQAWLIDNEIYDVNIKNAFDLLATLGSGNVLNDTFEMDVDIFCEYTSDIDTAIKSLYPYVEKHIILSADTFKRIWNTSGIDDILKLFVAYIIDENMYLFGDRWLADMQIRDIQNWESKYSLENILSENYGTCLEFFIQHKFVYESSWTSYGNPREYSLCNSISKLFFSEDFPYRQALDDIKNQYYFDLPF
ncbi:MAG: toll/interleukin-1 receptor domain-containing protein [Clostridia bacterium]|nr:toll/interleukin-1 receptor domain-containing protein [Clostridia bacterium]